MSSRPTPLFLLALAAAALYAASLSLPAFTCANTKSFPGYAVLLVGWAGMMGLDPRWLANIGVVLILFATLKPTPTHRPGLAMTTSVLAVAAVMLPAAGCEGMGTPNMSNGLAVGGYLWVAALLLASSTNAVLLSPRERRSEGEHGDSTTMDPGRQTRVESASGPASERMFAHGACTGCPEQDEMAELLSRHGLAVSKGQYNIKATACELFRFESWRPPGDWTLDGTAARPEVLWSDARLVSKVLTDAGIRHWLGVFDGTQNQMGYLHFDWPEEDSPSTR